MPSSAPVHDELIPPEHFWVRNGTKVENPHRDPRFPALYRVSSHPLVPDTKLVENIFVFVMDTSKKAMDAKREYENKLMVPLGPDSLMEGKGLIEIPDRSVVFAREKGPVEDQDPMADVIYAYVVNAQCFLNDEEIRELERIRDLVLGPEHEVTNEPPTLDASGEFVGGTKFERDRLRDGFPGVNGSRCYTLTLSHQHPPNKVAPTVSVKVRNEKLSPVQEVQKQLVKAMTAVATKALKRCAPKSFVDLLEQHAEWENVPVIGYEGNCFTPALQANLAPAVAYSHAQTSGLDQMGSFGALDGHIDGWDSTASLTSMINASRIPSTYEGGRFHLLSLGVYIRLQYLSVLAFSGLNKHGGTPPIAPPGEELEKNAVWFITVCYPPKSMLNGSSNVRVNLASLGRGILTMTPEVACNRFVKDPSPSNETSFGPDGRVIMEPYQNLQFLGRGLLQIALHVVGQLPPEYKAQVDPVKFLDSFRLPGPNGQPKSLGPWLGFSKPEATLAGVGVVDQSVHMIEPDTLMPAAGGLSNSMPDIEVSHAGWDSYAAARKAHYLAWVEHCEKQGKFIPSMMGCDWEGFRQRIQNDDFSNRTFPKGRLGRPSSTKRKDCEGAGDIEKDKPNRKKAKNSKGKGKSMGENPSTSSTSSASLFGANLGVGTIMQNIDDAPPEDIVDIESEDEIVDGRPSSTVIAALNGSRNLFELECTHEDVIPSEEDALPAVSPEVDPAVEEDQEDQTPRNLNVGNPASYVFFLDSLSIAAIEESAANFASAIGSLKTMRSAADLMPIATACQSALSAISGSPLDLQTVNHVLSTWATLGKLEQFANSQSANTAMTRALVMLSEWSLFSWVNTVIRKSLEATSYTRRTWIDQLVDDVKSVVIDPAGTRREPCPIHVFDINQYLPDADGTMNSCFTYKRLAARRNWTFNGDSHIFEVAKVATAVVRKWLNFPDDNLHISRFIFLDILLQPSTPKSVLYLDAVWQAFCKPSSLIKGQNYKLAIEARFEPFRQAYLIHPINDSSTTHHKLLLRLYQLVLQFEGVLSNQPIKTLPSLPADVFLTSNPSHNEDPQNIITTSELGKQRFLQYLRALYPLLESPLPHANPSSLVSAVAADLDFLSPFRQKAPMIQLARRVLYSDQQRLLTQTGIFNILSYRGAFYGSSYAKSQDDFQFFNDLEAWFAFYATVKTKYPSTPAEEQQTKSGKPAGAAEKYLINKRAYGPANKTRTTQLIPIYWNAAPLLLRFLLQEKRSVTDVYNFLQNGTIGHVRDALFRTPSASSSSSPASSSSSSSSSSGLHVNSLDDIVSLRSLHKCFSNIKKTAFPNIGPLAGLLLCGDLVEAGVLDMPTPYDLGLLVAKVEKGALKGLHQLGLVATGALKDENVIANAFSDLHNSVLAAFSPDEQYCMGYNVLMLEHGLCKMTRVAKHLPWA